MKRTFSVILAIILTLSLFTGCNNTGKDPVTEVTDENVKELFIPSLEAYVLYMGSAFYDVDRDGNGKAINYYLSEKFDVDVAESYKIVSDITVEEIENKMKTYMDTTKVSDIGIRLSEFGKEWFAEVDNELYVGLACCGMAVSYYDENSIELYKKEDNKYYISVDEYGIYPITDENHNEGDFVYSRSVIFTTTLKDGVLYINDIDRDGIIKENTNSETDRRLVTDIAKMPEVANWQFGIQ